MLNLGLLEILRKDSEKKEKEKLRVRVNYKTSFYCATCGAIIAHGIEREARNGWKLCPFCGNRVRTRAHYHYKHKRKSD